MLVLVFLISLLLVPSAAEAWGPLTHVYLANQVLDLGLAAMPAGIYGIIKKYKNDFIYGNLSADIILGKSFQGLTKNSHSWDIAWNLFKSASTDSQKAFAYGYLTHLSADTVVHNLKNSTMPFKHSVLEVKSESLIDKKYRLLIKRLDKIMQKNHDVFLEGKLESVFFSFKTNRRLFKSFLVLSRLPNYPPVSYFIDNRFPHEIPVVDIYNFQKESLSRMCELLRKGKKSEVLKNNPVKRSRSRASRFIRRAS
jgi:hypothetical protein